MELSKKVESALNRQITHELEAWGAYLSISAYFETLSLSGMASWMRKQSEEEMAHAMKIFDYVNDRGGKVALEALAAPPATFGAPLAAFGAALAHEQRNTKYLEELVDVADAEKDKATVSFMKWFIDEQVEEEDNARQNVEMVKMAGESKGTLLHLDHRMGKRGEKE